MRLSGGETRQKHSTSVRYLPRSEQVLGERKYEAIEAILSDISATSYKLIMHSLSTVVKNREVDELIKHGIMPYIYAAGFLSFAGEEINWENLARVVKTLGLVPNERIIMLFLRSGVRSHLIYLYSFYFLLANGEKPTRERIRYVVEAMGQKVDHSALEDVLDFLRRNNRFTRI